MTKRNLLVLGIILLNLVLIVTLFMVVHAKEAPVETLHLGATVPFQSRSGIQLKNILYMNADILNKAGGVTVGGKTYKIEYHIYDDKYQVDPARAAIERLVFENKIKFNIGTFASAPTLAMLGVTEPNRIPIFGGAASEKLLNPNIKYFVHCYSSKNSAAALKALLEVRPDIKKIILCAYDDETGHALVPPLEKASKVFGIETLPALYFKHGETDFSRIATKAISLKPDLFYIFGATATGEVVQCVKALREAGYKKTIKSTFMDQNLVDAIVEKVGKEGAEGIYSAYFNDPTSLVLRRSHLERWNFARITRNTTGSGK